jgi:hypothetical protein
MGNRATLNELTSGRSKYKNQLRITCIDKLYRFEAHLPIFKEQFSSPTNNGLTADGYSDFFNFSTGRRGVVSLHTVFTLRPRHDFAQMIFQFLWGLQDLRYQPRDELELDLKLAPDSGFPDFVFAVVSKEQLAVIRDNRWDLVRSDWVASSRCPHSCAH